MTEIIENLRNELASLNGVLEKARSDEEARMAEEKKIEEKRAKEMQMLKQQISDLEKELSSMEADNGAKIEGLTKELARREEQVLSLEKMAESLKGKDNDGDHETIGRLEEEMSRVKEQKEKEISELRDVIEHRDKKILSLKEIMAKNCCELELKMKSSQLMAAKKVQGGRSMTPTKSNQNNLIKQLEKRLQESTAVLDQKNSQLISKNNTIAKLESSLKELEAGLSLKEEVEENLQFVEGELQIKEEETQEEIKKLTEERDGMKDEIQTWLVKVKNLEEVEENLSKQLQTQVALVTKHEGEIEVREFILSVKIPSQPTCIRG
jgi:chromosome segregation ATPase